MFFWALQIKKENCHSSVIFHKITFVVMLKSNLILLVVELDQLNVFMFSAYINVMLRMMSMIPFILEKLGLLWTELCTLKIHMMRT